MDITSARETEDTGSIPVAYPSPDEIFDILKVSCNIKSLSIYIRDFSGSAILVYERNEADG